MRKYEAIKKIELNCHLDGSIDLDLASIWLKKSKEETRSILTRTAGVKNLKDYLEKFEIPISLLQLKTHLKETAFALAETMKKENVIYAEIRFAPLLHTKKNLSIDDVIEAVLAGIKVSKLKANLILTMKREETLDNNKKVIDTAKKYINKGVCAVDLAGDEELYPTSAFKELFEYANELEVPFIVTAGESGTFRDITFAIEAGAKRIGHGVQSIKSFDAMEALKKKHIPLEICLTCNLDTHLYYKITDHPISRLIDSGVLVTINSGNRTISRTDLSHEYYLLNKYFNFNKDDFIRCNRIAIEHAFISDEEKEDLLLQLEK